MKLYLYQRNFPAKGRPLLGGIAKAVHGLAWGLVDCGAEVTILCESEQPDELVSDAGYLIKSFSRRDVIRSFYSSTPLRRFLQDEVRQGLVLLNGIFHPGVYLMSRLLRKFKAQYIVAPHDPYNESIFSDSPFKKWIYWHFFERKVLQHAQAIQVLYLGHEAFLSSRGIKTPVVETPNGYSPRDILPEEGLSWSTDAPIQLFFLGRVDAYNKGLDLLIEAFARLSEEKDLTLTIQGPDWGDLVHLQDLAGRLGIADRVFFPPPDYDQRSTHLIAPHDIFCLPSRYEGFGLSALEAMLTGRVLLVSGVAGIAPHVEASNSGLLVEPSVDSVYQGLRTLIDRRAEWREMGLRGRTHVLTHLSWPSIAGRSLLVYQEILSRTSFQ